MKTVKLIPRGRENQTEELLSALEQLKEGGKLEFEKGEYHFYPDNAKKIWLAPSNNENGEKNIVFYVDGIKNLTVDGGGSTFVFHSGSFPFAILNSENITLCNMTLTTASLPYFMFEVGEKKDDGFYLKIDSEQFPYKVDDGGHLLLLGEDGGVIFDSSEEMFSLHSLERIFIRYLFTGECTATRENLATRFIEVFAEKSEDGVFLRYANRDPRGISCDFKDGETLATLPYERKQDLIFLSESSDIKIEDVTVNRGVGMGIIAQCSHNITLHRFNAIPINDEPATLTADAMHFVNCTGLIDIRDCVICRTMDDMLNVHGMYTSVSSAYKQSVTVEIGHHEQTFFLPYHKGDRLCVIDRNTLEIKGWLTAVDYKFTDKDGRVAKLSVEEANTSFVLAGDLIEVPDRMPDLNFVGNKGYEISRVLMSGKGNYLYKDCELHGFVCAVSARDVPGYWYESGRLGNLTVENNLFDAKWDYPHIPVIEIGVAGFAPHNAPLVHENITLRNNTIINAEGRPENSIGGVKNLSVE